MEFFVISNPTEGQYEKFREFKDLNSTRVIFLHLKKSYRSKLQIFLIGFAKAPTPVFPSREGKSEDKQPIGG